MLGRREIEVGKEQDFIEGFTEYKMLSQILASSIWQSSHRWDVFIVPSKDIEATDQGPHVLSCLR